MERELSSSVRKAIDRKKHFHGPALWRREMNSGILEFPTTTEVGARGEGDEEGGLRCYGFLFFCAFLSLMSKGMNGWVVEEEEAWLEI
jgi:hypothetical protein